MSLIQGLPTGALDIVGDIHGEYEALRALVGHLGYDTDGHHPHGRTLIFVGDFCDRGPNSPAVLAWVQKLVETQRAMAILGNHEMNLLCGDAKDGSGWFFDVRIEHDNLKYAPYQRPAPTQRAQIVQFLSSLPIGLEREDLRVIHAAWQEPQINTVRTLPLGSAKHYNQLWETAAKQAAIESQVQQRIDWEVANLAYSIEDPDHTPPFLHAQSELDALKQIHNPLKVLMNGVERKAKVPFYASGKWRFTDRVAWWDAYEDDIPVVVGHYWRRIQPATDSKKHLSLFNDIAPTAWHGKRQQVFCIDYSAGGKWLQRKAEKANSHHFHLGALRWPERTVMLDNGHHFTTA